MLPRKRNGLIEGNIWTGKKEALNLMVICEILLVDFIGGLYEKSLILQNKTISAHFKTGLNNASINLISNFR